MLSRSRSLVARFVLVVARCYAAPRPNDSPMCRRSGADGFSLGKEGAVGTIGLLDQPNASGISALLATSEPSGIGVPQFVAPFVDLSALTALSSSMSACRPQLVTQPSDVVARC